MIQSIKDLLWPKRCLFCEQLLLPDEAGPVCSQCHIEDDLITGFRCRICSRPVDEENGVCTNCLIHHRTVPGFSLLIYDGAVQEAIHRLKYDSRKEHAEDFANLLNQWREQWDQDAGVLIPIPVHPERKKTRGYDQAAEIAFRLSFLTGIPAVTLLRRIKNTRAQSRLSAKERAENLKGAFSVNPEEEKKIPAQKDLILVDDIYTSGSTVEAAAEVIRHAFPGRNIRFLCVSAKLLPEDS